MTTPEQRKFFFAVGKRIRRAAEKHGVTSSSVTLAHRFTDDPQRLWWFGDNDDNLLSSEGGLTDGLALAWLADNYQNVCTQQNIS